MLYGDKNQGQHWRQAITWTNVDLSSKVFYGIHQRATLQELLQNLVSNVFRDYTFKITTTLPRVEEINMKLWYDPEINWDFMIPATLISTFAVQIEGNVNPLCAKFFRENINMYLHFMSFLHTNKASVVEIPPRVRQGPAYST